MKYSISIPKPCHEDWNGMTPNEQGRFCMQCSKTVTDFTGMKASEIQSYLLDNRDKKVCGRFQSAQLEKVTITVPEKVLFTQTKFRNVFLLALLVTMGTTLMSCNNGQTIGEVVVEKDTIAIDSGAIQHAHTMGIPAVVDSLPPPPQLKLCKPLTGEVDMSTYNSANGKEVHLTGAVAVAPVPPPKEDYPLMGDIIINPVNDTLPPPTKAKE